MILPTRPIPPFALLPLLAWLATTGQAQTLPDAGSLLRQQEQLQQRVPNQLPPRQAEESRPPLKVGAGETVRVNAVRFSGATDLAPDAELQLLVADAIGRELDFAALQQLIERVTTHLKKRGWFLARAYLPQQDITAGVIEITLLTGRLSENDPVRITSGGKLALRIDPARLVAIAAKAIPAGSAAREDDLNRAILLMNDLPGIVAGARLEPGEAQGETRIALTVDEGPLFSGNLVADNHGSRDTGRDQLNVGLSLNDPFGLGDQINLGTTGSAGVTLGRLGYSLPLGSDGWKLNAGYTDMRYEVRTPIGRAAGLDGESQTVTAGVSYPWLRSRTANVYLNIGLASKHLVDRSNADTIRDKQVDVSNFTLSGDRLDGFGGGGFTSWSAGLVVGQLSLNQAADAAADAASYHTAGSYSKFSYNLARLQKLPGAFTLFANLAGQQAANNLDTSEKLYLGGPSGVRAYPGSEAGGDSAQILNLEVRYDWPIATPLGNLQLQGFYDAGWTQLHHDPGSIAIPSATGQNHYGIAGFGLGLSFMKPGRHVIRASVASKLGSNPGRSVQGLDADGLSDNTRFWLQAVLLFWP